MHFNLKGSIWGWARAVKESSRPLGAASCAPSKVRVGGVCWDLTVTRKQKLSWWEGNRGSASGFLGVSLINDKDNC